MARKLTEDSYVCPSCGWPQCKDMFYVSAKGRISGWCKKCTADKKHGIALCLYYKGAVRPALNRFSPSLRKRMNAERKTAYVYDVARDEFYEWPKFRRSSAISSNEWYSEIVKLYNSINYYEPKIDKEKL